LGYNAHYLYSGYNYWCLAISLTDSKSNTLTVVNVYYPCDCYGNVDKNLDYLGKTQAFISDIVGPYVILGDFNCNPLASKSPCGKLLNDFNEDYDLVLIDGSLPAGSYTFVGDVWHSTSWLDHCRGPQYMLDMIDDCYIVQDSYDSDHYPISFPVLGASQESWVSPPICLPKPNLGKVTPTDIESFQSCIESYLCSINLCNCDVICCSDAACYRSDHKAEIESLYHYSYNCLTNATKQCFSQRRPDSNFKKRVPGWNEYVCEAKAAASDVHYL